MRVKIGPGPECWACLGWWQKVFGGFVIHSESLTGREPRALSNECQDNMMPTWEH